MCEWCEMTEPERVEEMAKLHAEVEQAIGGCPELVGRFHAFALGAAWIRTMDETHPSEVTRAALRYCEAPLDFGVRLHAINDLISPSTE